VAAPELPWAGQRELDPHGMWRPRSYPGRAAGAGFVGHVVVPELAWAMQFMLRLTTRRTCDLHVSPSVLTWNLYAGVTDLQGTDKKRCSIDVQNFLFTVLEQWKHPFVRLDFFHVIWRFVILKDKRTVKIVHTVVNSHTSIID
jgi:hypothetical protein